MSAWSEDELRRIGGAEELQIAAMRRDGTLRSGRPIWVVRAGDDLYVRALDAVDAAYREKYGRRYASIVDSINDEAQRATTLRLLPH